VDPVPDPLLRKSGSPGNVTRTSGSAATSPLHTDVTKYLTPTFNVIVEACYVPDNAWVHLQANSRQARKWLILQYMSYEKFSVTHYKLHCADLSGVRRHFLYRKCTVAVRHPGIYTCLPASNADPVTAPLSPFPNPHGCLYVCLPRSGSLAGVPSSRLSREPQWRPFPLLSSVELNSGQSYVTLIYTRPCKGLKWIGAEVWGSAVFTMKITVLGGPRGLGGNQTSAFDWFMKDK
jgi:hypothetical protein